MRIGYVLKRYPRYSETFIVAELLAHQAAGLDVTIFGLRQPTEPCPQPAVERVRFPVEYLTDDDGRHDREERQARWLADRVRALRLDLLHAHFATTATVVAARAAALAGIPFTFTAHAKDIYHQDVDPMVLAARIDAAARVVTVSEFNRRHLAGLSGSSADRVVRVYNGIDLTEYPIGPDAARQSRVLAVGRLVEKKGFGDLIDAIGRLARRGRPIPCDIVGAGPLEADLRGRVASLGLDHLVRFHGLQSRETVAELLRRTGVFVAPCVVSDDGDRDGLPTVLLEAMASGTPAIATPVTGIPELVHHGVTGWLCPSRDPELLAALIAGVLDDPARSAEVGRAARTRIERDFDLTTTTAQLRAVFAVAVTDRALQGVG
ncbi:MAG: glycosyltransferase family 4 protein [Gemmatimonadales bacterium]|nr:glycosyltransferase family 4 protein [Gemmatimonadales bacterium]